MSQRQRKRRIRRRREAQRRRPNKRKVTTGATLALGATLAATGSAQGATLTVSNLNDNGPGSLRQAIHDANADETTTDNIVFASGLTGTIDVGTAGSDGLYPETPMTIQGPGADKLTLRGVNNADYVIFTGAGYGASPGVPVGISGLTVTGGDATNHHFSDSGGGLYNKDANLTLSDMVITGNHASDDGAGIYTRNAAGSVTVVNSTISGNSAGSPADTTSFGGGIFSKYSDVSIRNSTISENQSGGDGGAIYISSGFGSSDAALSVENSTIANNRVTSGGVDDEGGGLWVGEAGNQSIDVKSSTITGNSVGGSKGLGGGVYTYLPASSVSIQNTIVANNSGTRGNDVYLLGGGQVGFSLIKDTANATDPSHSFNPTGPNLFGVDPQLGPLANHGGPTQTEAPGPTSPVIDKGASAGLNSDQRGVLRPIDFPAISNSAGGNGADIGAVEFQPSNVFKLGKLKRNKQKGTGKQVVKLTLPAVGSLTIKGKGLKSKTKQVTGKKKKVKLPVIPRGRARSQESATGAVKLKAKIIYKPTGSATKTLKRKLKLLKS